ncbi:MAG: TetR/AcrR family transcriptional regulator [Lachnospiraceae bacterium]|nr:TetR/AcrR family transcriptional regulator [Lachnospiraceae bacterium]
MNPKFFDVKKEKQDAIINACLKVFAENGYKKASTDVIVKTAGISKGLLFHYFESKKGAYEFIFDYSVKYMTLELTQSVKKSERDFFEIQKTIEGVKTRVMRNYPHMQQFLDSVRFEEHPDALAAIGEDRNVLRNTYNEIYRQADMSRFDESVDVNRVINMISWMSEGYIRDRFREDEEPDLDEVSEEFAGYLRMLRSHFYRSGDRRLSFAYGSKQPQTVTRNTGMAKTEQKAAKQPTSLSQLANQMNREAAKQLSFEERLARKDTSIFGVPIPPKEEKKEIKKPEPSASKEAPEKEAEPAVTEAEVKEPILSEDEGKKATPKEVQAAEPAAEEKMEEAVLAETEKLISGEKSEDTTEAWENEKAEQPIETETNETEEPEPAVEPEAEEIRAAVPDTEPDNDADSDMVDLSALFSKRLEEATEELMTGTSAEYTEMPVPGEQEYYYPELQPEDAGYEEQAGFYGQDLYGYPQEGYDPNMGFPGIPPLPEGYVFEDDSQAYVELYNSVNNYDINGATQEMPVNEVLAYRNAFTNEYIREELQKNGEADQAAIEPEPERKEKKPKKKSFFAGLFGKGNKENGSEEDSTESDTGEVLSDSGDGQGEGTVPPGQAPVLPEYDPNAAGMGNFEPASYYNMKF